MTTYGPCDICGKDVHDFDGIATGRQGSSGLWQVDCVVHWECGRPSDMNTVTNTTSASHCIREGDYCI
jgi:hypothetical protein